MDVEVWSDVICPWCYVGKRRLERAISAFDHAVNITWRSFELDPGAPAERRGDMRQHLARKYGMSTDDAGASIRRLTRLAAEDGLEYHLDRTRPGNTFDAHRLLHVAGERGVQGALKERLLSAYFTEGLPVGDRSTLVSLAVSVGLDESEAVSVLAGDAYADAVRADEQEAYEIGVSGVPFMRIDHRFAIPGAQDSDTILIILERAWERAAAS